MEQDILRAVNAAIGDSIRQHLTGYSSPINGLVSKVVQNHSANIEKVIDKSVTSLIKSDGFECAIHEQLNKKLAQVLISKMSGELEKQVNILKQNPQTRAKITLAISDIINDLSVVK